MRAWEVFRDTNTLKDFDKQFKELRRNISQFSKEDWEMLDYLANKSEAYNTFEKYKNRFKV